MSRVKRAELHPAQGVMLEPIGSQEIAVEGFRPVIDQQLVLGEQNPIVHGVEGSYMQVEKRAEFLVAALGAINQRNKRIGFRTASKVFPHKARIETFYGEELPLVQVGAQENAEMFHNVARRALWAATGFVPLLASGLVTKEQVDGWGSKIGRDFAREYGFPKDVKARNKYKAQLQKVIQSSEDTNAA
jgi:hypothetical protein